MESQGVVLTETDSTAADPPQRRGVTLPRRATRATGLLLFSLPLVAFAAHAEEPDDYDPFDRPGFYMGIGGSYQRNVFESQFEDAIDKAFGSSAVDVSLDLEDSGGLNAVVGYRATSFFAIELAYEWVGKYDVGAGAKVEFSPPVRISTKLYSIEGHTLTANTKWIVPFWRIQPYLLIGGGLAVAKVERGDLFEDPLVQLFLDREDIDIDQGTHTNAAGRAGLGVDIYVNEKIVVNVGAGILVTTLKEPDTGDIDDLNYISFQAGLQVRF